MNRGYKSVKKSTKRPARIAKRKTNSSIARIAVKAVQDKVLEKKQLEFTSANRPVGAISYSSVSGASSGWNIIGPLNYIPQGTGDAQRLGNRIKPYSLNIRGSIIGQVNYNSNTSVRIQLIYYNDWTTGTPLGFTGSINDGQLYNLNSIGLVDSRNIRNTDYLENYTVLKTMKIELPLKSYVGQQTSADFNFYYKFSPMTAPDRYLGSANTDLSSKALFVLITSDYGNIGVSNYTPATANLPIIPAYSGVNIEYMGRYSFTDA